MDKEELHQIFSHNLKARMKENGINQTELSKRLGVSPAQVSAWVNGVHMPRSNHLASLTEIFDCLPSQLLTESKQAELHYSRPLPEGYFSLNDRDRDVIDKMIQTLASNQSKD